MSEEFTALKKLYSERRREIRKRLNEFREILNKPDEEIFAELCFCICTPQSKAEVCDRAVQRLKFSHVLQKGSVKDVRRRLDGVRFAPTKARHIVRARNLLTSSNGLSLGERLKSAGDSESLRDWLVDNVYGLGMKEASHFLRNVGLGEELSILDRHILRNLTFLGIVKNIGKTLTRKRYLEIERRMKFFAKELRIPMGELDLLLWSKETGKVFK